jgi:hypothetical protein
MLARIRGEQKQVSIDARHGHQILHRHLRPQFALAHLLLDRFRQQLPQRQPPRYPTPAAVEAPRQLAQRVAEALFHLSQQPAFFERTLLRARCAAISTAVALRLRSLPKPSLPPCPGRVVPARPRACGRRHQVMFAVVLGDDHNDGRWSDEPEREVDFLIRSRADLATGGCRERSSSRAAHRPHST